MAQNLQRITRRAGFALLLSFLATAGRGALNHPATQQSKLMFTPPNGWRMTQCSERLIFFDAPDLKDKESCRIAVGTPMDVPFSFAQWFGDVQAPDPVVSESRVTEDKTKRGY